MTTINEKPSGVACKRVEERYRVTLQVLLTVLGRKSYALETSDISFHGLFLKTQTPPDLRSLVKLAVNLPSGRTLEMHGMAVYVVKPGDPSQRAPGVGIQFYAVDKDTQTAWVDQVRGIATALAAFGEAERRNHPRWGAELDLELRTVNDLQLLLSRDVSEGGMFIVTELLLPLGECLRIHVLHPVTGQAFPLEAVVRRQEFQPAQGLGVEFVGMDASERAAFVEFIHGSIDVGEPEKFEIIDIDLMAS